MNWYETLKRALDQLGFKHTESDHGVFVKKGADERWAGAAAPVPAQFNFDDLTPSSIPMDPSVPLLKSQSPSTLADIAKMKSVLYREAAGSLMYAAMGSTTRHRICNLNSGPVPGKPRKGPLGSSEKDL